MSAPEARLAVTPDERWRVARIRRWEDDPKGAAFPCCDCCYDPCTEAPHNDPCADCQTESNADDDTKGAA